MLLLLVSTLYQAARAPRRPSTGTPQGQTLTAQVPAWNKSGPAGGNVEISYRYWPGAPHAPAVLLIHGSPGAGDDFDKLSPLLQAAGYTVIAPDLPGFNASTPNPPSMSIFAHAHEMVALLDHLGVQRVHVVGWSLGGGVALHLTQFIHDRVATLTLLASISEQGAEGSGSYRFEHAKYATGYAFLTGLRYLTPHFGLLSGADVPRASMRNFWDSDMRPLRAIMRGLDTPTMVLHGRHDFLVPDWAAERSHELIGPSTLVMLDASHFIPFLQHHEAAANLIPFFHRHDTPGAPALRQTIDYAPAPPALLGLLGQNLSIVIRHTPWIILLPLLALGVAAGGRLGAVLVAILMSFLVMDFGIGIGAVLLGQLLAAAAWFRRGRQLRLAGENPRSIGPGALARTPADWAARLREGPVRTAISTRFAPGEHQAAWTAAGFLGRLPLGFALGAAAAWVLWMLFFVLFTLIAGLWTIRPLTDLHALPGAIIGAIILIYLPRPLAMTFTRQGRRMLRTFIGRAVRREYWPTWLLYAPLYPYYTYLGLRHGPIVFTCCNPGIPGGGGVIGESKKAILDALAAPQTPTLPTVLIPEGPDAAARARQALDAIESRTDLGGFPVILKPDAGLRGFGVKIARSEADVRDYFRTVLGDALVQRFHPGPHECGILWAKHPGGPGEGGRTGFIFSITRKEFPLLKGDGRRTLEDLVYAHPRFHCQAGVFLERFAHDRARVLADGETLRLAQSGNHCQGTLFCDGSDLITPALEARIDQIARGFSSGGGLDIGRFDVRFESEDALRRGEGFAILELNGTTGESTNIYDPRRSILWCYVVLIRQWRLLYHLGAARRDSGARPLPVLHLFRELARHYQTRTGSALAD